MGGCLQVTNHHLALPRAFPTDTTALLADANEFSLAAPRETGTLRTPCWKEMEPRHRWSKLLSQGHASPGQRSLQDALRPGSAPRAPCACTPPGAPPACAQPSGVSAGLSAGTREPGLAELSPQLYHGGTAPASALTPLRNVPLPSEPPNPQHPTAPCCQSYLHL